MATNSTSDRERRQRKLLDQLARQIPALIKAIERGDSAQSIMIVGHKHLADGRLAEVRLVAEITEARTVGGSYNELPAEE